ncbi:hypothetical protein LRAMOSA08970 [Lichtheimia ramosa]|uniref:F-box domain-containing protein n=1 Tax=Lichtheimia ramosa TaxID=688394 RepID=A0A077WII9_9FUNG|nr:hypothetical protein LRAMOSA08970 [Lichtheimia ramosa]
MSQNAVLLLNKYHRTLQHITWYFKSDSNEDIYSIQFPQLKKLCLIDSGWWILRNAPMLEELDITSKTISTNPAIFNTTPTNLRKLRILLSNGRYLSRNIAVARYIYSFSQQSQLQHIDISIDSHDNTQDVLDAICHLHQLRRLSINLLEDRHSYAREPMVWNSHAMEQFLDTLSQSSSQLSCLEIRYKNAPSSYSINALKRLEYLKQFAFSIDGIDDDYSFWNAIQTMPQLETISIYPTSAVKKDDINFLIHHRPSMKIIISGYFTPF